MIPNKEKNEMFTPEGYLDFLSQVVNVGAIRRCFTSSADHRHYKYDYIKALTLPLETGRFPAARLSDLNFVLGNLLVGLDGDEAVKKWERLYLASLYLYVRQVEQGGMQLTEKAVRLALEVVLVGSSSECLSMFEGYLIWLLDQKVASTTADSYFIRLGAFILRSQILNIKEGELVAIKRHLPSWVRDVRHVGLLTDDPNFPQSWNRLLMNIKYSKKIESLLGMPSDSCLNNRQTKAEKKRKDKGLSPSDTKQGK